MIDRTPKEAVINCLQCMDKFNEEDGCPHCDLTAFLEKKGLSERDWTNDCLPAQEI